MVLNTRKADDRHKITDNTKFAKISQSFEAGKHLELDVYEGEAAVLYQLQEMTDDIKEIHRYLGAEVGDGAKGDTGNTGAKGDKGDTGAAGSNGSNGAAGAAGAAGKDAGLYTDNKGVEYIFLPPTAFTGVGVTALSNQSGANVSHQSDSLHAMWPGLTGKKVVSIYVHTNASKGVAASVNVYRTQLGTATALLSKAGNSDTALNITDWTCAFRETISITMAPKATNVKVHGITLTLG